jgi:hypothetical protein
VIRTKDGREFGVRERDSLRFAEEGMTAIAVTADQKFHILATDLVARIGR